MATAAGTAIDEKLLEEKLSALEQTRAWSPRMISRLEALLHSPDDFALYRVNPVRFASEKGADEMEAIDLFLHASKLGLFKMEWHLICPSCGDASESFSSLSGLHSEITCTLCDLSARAHLDDFIEISFSVSPQIRACSFHKPESLSVEDFYYKFHYNNGAYKEGMPPFAQMLQSVNLGLSYLEPGKARSFKMTVAPGYFAGHDLILDKGWGYEVKGEPAVGEQKLTLRLDEAGFSPHQGGLRPGALELTIENTLPKRASFMAIQLPPGHFESREKSKLNIPPFLTGNRLLNSQTFRNLFRGETIQGNEGIGVRDLTLLFTDLKGSTEMYERIGDLKAFALVQQHFDHLGNSIRTHRGAMVKTIGDAVMASFDKPADALEAAIEMLKEIDAFNISQGADEIILKIGIHHGPSIAVTLNDRLDFFGQTVNIAARVQGLAGAEEICLTEESYKAGGVAELLKGLNVKAEMASIKGIQKKMKIYRISETLPAKSPQKRPAGAGPKLQRSPAGAASTPARPKKRAKKSPKKKPAKKQKPKK